MVMDILAIIVLCLVATVLCKVMDKYSKEYALFISLGVCIIIMLVVMTFVSPILETINTMFNSVGIGTDNIKILVKSIGICYITQLASDVCKDSNYQALSTQIELVGKISLILFALPLLKTMITVVNELASL